MENIKVPYRVDLQVATFEGEWTAEQIDSGEAGKAARTETQSVWYEPTENGPVEITDPERLRELNEGVEARYREAGLL